MTRTTHHPRNHRANISLRWLTDIEIARVRRYGMALALLGFAACTTAVGTDQPVSPASELLLDTIEAGQAPLSCERLLDDSEAFALDEGGFVVAFGRSGQPLCIDTIEATTMELRATGRIEEAELLRMEAERLFADEPPLVEPSGVGQDPNPQPSFPETPSPPIDPTQDSLPRQAFDPNPQPSCPRDDHALHAGLVFNTWAP